MGGWWVGQAITDPIAGPSFDVTLTIGPELDNNEVMIKLTTGLSAQI